MRTSFHPRTLSVLLLAFAFILAACGGGESTAPPSPSPTTPAPTDGPTDEPTDGPQPCTDPGNCDPSDELIAAAQAEGELVTYSAVATALQEQFAAAFHARYGVTLNFAQVGNAEVLERSRLEVESGRVIVDWINTSTEGHHEFMVENDSYMYLDPEELPNLAVVTGESQWYKGDGHYVFWGGVGYLMAWNSELVPDEDVPDDWCGLTDPKFRGRIGSVDQPGALSLYTMWSMAAEDCGDDFLEAMAEQNITWYSSTSNSSPALAAGEIAITTHGLPHQLLPLVDAGAPLEWKTMESMSIGPRFFAIMKDAPHPNAAKLFANWILSEEAQLIAFDGQQGVTVLPDKVPDPVVLPGKWVIANAADYPDDFQSSIRQALGLE